MERVSRNAVKAKRAAAKPAEAIPLPEPRRDGRASLERCLAARRSARTFRNAPLTLAEAGQLLWAAQGITSRDGHRTAPSAGALYPLELYLVAGNVEGLEPGVYKYEPRRHALLPGAAGDKRKELAAAALDQDFIARAPAGIVVAAVYQRTMGKYGARGESYVHMEAGHAAQSVCLQAAALGLDSMTVGAFRDAAVKRLTGLAANEDPLYILLAGRK